MKLAINSSQLTVKFGIINIRQGHGGARTDERHRKKYQLWDIFHYDLLLIRPSGVLLREIYTGMERSQGKLRPHRNVLHVPAPKIIFNLNAPAPADPSARWNDILLLRLLPREKKFFFAAVHKNYKHFPCTVDDFGCCDANWINDSGDDSLYY